MRAAPRTLLLTTTAPLTTATLTPALAQDLTIANVRIIGPNVTVIERGSIVVRGGRIVSAAAGAAASTSGTVIDARGMTAMPGFIDAHRHINTARGLLELAHDEGHDQGRRRRRRHAVAE